MSVLGEFAQQHPGPWTAQEWLELGELPAWPRIELIDGSLYVSPYSNLAHQRACARLATVLGAAFAMAPLATSPDLEVFSPANVALSDNSAVIPDVVVCRAGLTGLAVPAADVELLVEVESHATRSMDRLVKPDAYARAGVPAYWRVELGGDAGPVVCRYTRGQDAFLLGERVPAGHVFAAEVAGVRVEFDPAALAPQ